LQTGYAPGLYSLNIEIDTSDSSDIDFVPGQYGLTILFCEGECGSHHPHSKLYDTKNTTMVVTPHQ
jgi:hypothetical protein